MRLFRYGGFAALVRLFYAAGLGFSLRARSARLRLGGRLSPPEVQVFLFNISISIFIGSLK